MATNSSLHATVLTRLIGGTSPWLTWLWRRLLLALHGCDINAGAVFGPGLMMPHPTGIVIGPNTVIGRNAVILHLVSIGPVTTNWRGANTAGTINIGDDITVFPGAFILGELTIGDGAVVGAKALVTRDIPAGHIVNLRGVTRLATDAERGGYQS
jgi:serine O-acetyltransferase